MRFLRSLLVGVLIAFCTFAVLLVVTHEGRVAVQTLLMLPEVLPQAGTKPLASLTATPVAESVRYVYVGGHTTGTIYRPPDQGKHGAIILFLGINPDLQDATLQRLAEALARQGTVTLIAHPVELGQGQISFQEVENLIGAFRFLRAQPFVDEKKMGFGGFCVGSSIALIAAGDPRISYQVKFVNFFGGYYSAESLLTAMSTRQTSWEGVTEDWEPNENAYRWFAQQLLDDLKEPEGRDRLERYVSNGVPLPPAEVGDLPARAKAIYTALTNADPLVAGEVYEELPDDARARMAVLSPRSHLTWLQAKVFMMQDRDDSYVPYTEARRLWVALSDYPRKHYTEFSLFQHMHPSRSLPPLLFLQEAAKLYAHIYLLMLELS